MKYNEIEVGKTYRYHAKPQQARQYGFDQEGWWSYHVEVIAVDETINTPKREAAGKPPVLGFRVKIVTGPHNDEIGSEFLTDARTLLEAI